MVFSALGLGVSTGVVCCAHCLPSALPFLAAGRLERTVYAKKVGIFFAGRLAGYLLVGMVIGWLGYLTLGSTGPERFGRITVYANIAIGSFLIVYGIAFLKRESKLCAFLRISGNQRYGALILGFLTGINICPPFIAAAAEAYGYSSILNGITYFFFFFLGTSIYLLPLFLFTFLRKHQRTIQVLCRITLLIMGGYFIIWKGVMLL